MKTFFIGKHSRHGIFSYLNGACNVSSLRPILLCLVLGGLLSLMGCGYAGRPPGMGDPLAASSRASDPILQVTPASIGFGNVVSGVLYSQSVRLSNTGKADLTITQAMTSGSGFSVSGLSLPLNLPAGENATFTAAFESNVEGSAKGAITVAGNGTALHTTIDMSATVTSQQLQLTPSSLSLNFGNEKVGIPEIQNVTLTNTGNTGVTIAAVSESGTGFSVSGEPMVRLDPEQTVNIAVTFDPAGAGAATGTLTVTSNAMPLQIGLSGNGINTPSQHSVALSWSPSASAVAGYFVYRGDGISGSLSKLITSAIPTTSYVDSTVVGGQVYNYAVTSVNSANAESTYSNQVTVTVPGP